MVVRVERVLHLGAALVMCPVLRGRLRQAHDDVVRRAAPSLRNALDPRLVRAGAVHRRADVILVRRLVEVHRDLCAALEVYAQRDVVPEQDAQHAGNRKDQREAQEEPLLSKPVDISAAKQFHLKPSFRYQVLGSRCWIASGCPLSRGSRT